MKTTDTKTYTNYSKSTERVCHVDISKGTFSIINLFAFEKTETAGISKDAVYFSSPHEAIDAGFLPCSNTNLSNEIIEKKAKQIINNKLFFERQSDPKRITQILIKAASEYNLSHNIKEKREGGCLSFIPSPLGRILAAAVDGQLFFCDFFANDLTEQQLLSCLPEGVFSFSTQPVFIELKKQLAEYWRRQRREFDLPVAPVGSNWQRQVWQTLQSIPYGEKRSYQQQAEALTNSKATRAVAKANSANSVLIIIPCHRVVGKNGRLSGFGGGLWRKFLLLQHEQATVSPIAAMG